MPPIVLVLLLVAGLLALIPVWRLRAAGWPRPWLTTVWVCLAIAILLVLAFPAPARFLIPLLILAFLAPFVVAPERVARVLNGRGPRGVIIDVTPRIPRVTPATSDRDDATEPNAPQPDDTIRPDDPDHPDRPSPPAG